MSDHNNTQLSEERLEPCPFCGGNAEKRLTDGAGRGFVGCFTCMIGLPFNAPYGDAEVAAWNSRASVAASPAQNDATADNDGEGAPAHVWLVREGDDLDEKWYDEKAEGSPQAIRYTRDPEIKPDVHTWLKESCSRLVHGQCTTARCIERGGWTGGKYDPSIATCEAYEAYNALSRLPCRRRSQDEPCHDPRCGDTNRLEVLMQYPDKLFIDESGDERLYSGANDTTSGRGIWHNDPRKAVDDIVRRVNTQ